MVILGFALIGALWGFRTAVRRGGSGLDRAQYAGVGFIAGVILGAFASIGIERML